MTAFLKDKVAIVGIGKTKQGQIEGSTALGLGIALKVDDGAGRAAEVVMAGLLARFGIDEAEHELRAHPLRNRAGIEVGDLRPPADGPI